MSTRRGVRRKLPFPEVGMKFKKFIFSAFLFVSVISAGQQVARPTPQRIDIHSKILNEDRAIWVRTPPGYEQSKTAYLSFTRPMLPSM